MEEIGHLVGSLEDLIRRDGVIVVTGILALEALGAPLPGETLLIFSAIMVGHGDMSLPSLLICAWAGSVLGDNIGYLVGRTLGRTAVTRHGAKIGLTEPRFDAVEAVFARYGGATVMFARFVNVLRQLNGIVAGTLGMDWRRFLLFNALGAALWVTVWVFAALYLSEHLSVIVGMAHHIGRAGGALVVVALIVAAALAAWRIHRGKWSAKERQR